MGEGIANKDTWSAARGEFMRRVRPEPGIAQTTKDAKFMEIWWVVQELLIGRGHGHIDFGKAIDDVSGGRHSIRSIGERHEGSMK